MSDNIIEQPDFNTMDRPKLMQYASHLRLPFSNTATKADLIELIDRKLKGRTTPALAEHVSQVPPGHAKIRILEDPMPGSSNFPVYLNCNGYECTIPRGKDVIVPMRVVRTLTDATVKRKKQESRVDAQGREFTQDVDVSVPSYPFQVLEMTPGPEPLTNLERAKLKGIEPRRRYRNRFGYWPRPGQLHAAISKGILDLSSEEELPDSEAKFIENKELAKE